MEEKTSMEQNIEDLKPKTSFGVRHVQSTLLFLATTLCYAIRGYMSIALVSITDTTSSNNTYDWSSQTQSVILSSFFWGYIVPQIPAGIIATRFGGKWPIVFSLLSNAVLSLLFPLIPAWGGWMGVCGGRILQGMGQAFLYPSLHALIGRWIPPQEKLFLATLIYSGSQLGTAIQYVTSGYIASYLGWEWIFYSYGLVALVLGVCYIILGASTPASSRFISTQERDYILASFGRVPNAKRPETPWKAILTSVPFYALLITHCGNNWGYWTITTEMPLYFSNVLNVDIKSNGVLSSIPYMIKFIMSFISGYIADWVFHRYNLSVTAIRKVSNTIGFWGPAVSLVILTYAPSGVAVAVSLLSLTLGLNATQYTGYVLVHVDMSPNFGGVMMGITNFFSNIMSIIAPLAAGVIIKDETSEADWHMVFYVSAVIYFISNLIFIIFGSSVKQTWDTPAIDTKDAEEGDQHKQRKESKPTSEKLQ